MTEEQQAKRLAHYMQRTRAHFAHRLWHALAETGLTVDDIQIRTGITRSRLLDILAARTDTITLIEIVKLGMATTLDMGGSAEISLGPAWSHVPDFSLPG